MSTEDDTFWKLRKPNFDELYAILKKHPNEPVKDKLEFYGWSIMEFSKELTARHIAGILE
jgi:hypothetical protein